MIMDDPLVDFDPDCYARGNPSPANIQKGFPGSQRDRRVKGCNRSDGTGCGRAWEKPIAGIETSPGRGEGVVCGHFDTLMTWKS